MQSTIDPTQAEVDQLSDLLRSGVLDTGAEDAFDRIIWLIADVLRVPVVLIAVGDGDKRWHKVRDGLEQTVEPDELASWPPAEDASDVFEVPNAALDERFYQSPQVAGAPLLRFYASASLTTAAGFPLGTLCIASDSPRKLTDMERTKFRCFADMVESEFRMLSMVQEQDRLRMDAERATSIKTEFLSHMSHEIRTPLSGIIGATDLILAGGDDVSHMAKIVRSSAGDLLQLLNQALDSAKIERGGLDITPEPVNMRRKAEKIRRHFSVLANNKDLELEVECVFDGVPECDVELDPVRFRQVMFNIVHNAIKFTQDGGVRCEIRIGAGEDANSRRITATVLDTGIGMSPEGVAEIFEPFKQLDAGIERAYGGTGLGMSLVFKLIKMMGGDIQVTSKLGAGTKMVVTLDVQASSVPDRREEGLQESSNPVETGASKPLAGQKILIADDSAANREIMGVVVESWGGEAELVEDGEQAARATKSELYDAIVLDLHMPGKSGYEVVESVRRTGNWVRVVACTADLSPVVQQRCIDAGFDATVAKPIDWSAFLQALSGDQSFAAFA